MAKKTKPKFDIEKIHAFIDFIKKERARFIFGVIFAFIGAFILFGQISFFFTGDADQSKVENFSFWQLISEKQEIENAAGVMGAFFAERLINQWLGVPSLLISIFLIIIGLKLIRAIHVSLPRAFLVMGLILIWSSIFCSFVLHPWFGGSHISWGGAHGQYIVDILAKAIGSTGIFMVLMLLLIIFLVCVWKPMVAYIHRFFARRFEKKEKKKSEETEKKLEDEDITIPDGNGATPLSKTEEEIINITQDDFAPIEKVKTTRNKTTDVNDEFEVVVATESDGEDTEPKDPLEQEDLTDDLEGEEMEEYDPTLELSHFAFPSDQLLKVYETGDKPVDMEEQNANKEKIINTLRNYGIEITSIRATVGPTITLYEIIPKAGVRISKIRNLEDDIALSLSALGIRIIAPMPGKGTVGIEVPNKDPQIVSMRSVIASKKFQDCNYELPVALGRTITNEVFTFDLAKMPHLLVAGATGQGKSVGLNAIITSLLYKKHPAEMKMVLVDPKMVEFSIYSTIEKHYLAKLPDAEKAIITDVTKVTQTLNSLTREMDDRYELLMEAGVRNIKEYNVKFRKRRLNPLKGHKFLPYIVVIIDEFGDLIMTAGKEIEMPIARIAQKARAVGMHMIIATQRPTTNIITGTIKANFPARMAFRVTSQIDSRTILDMPGANQLIGRGDMLFSQGSDLTRIQCAFVDTPEVDEITNYIGNQQGYACAFELPEYTVEGGEGGLAGVDLNDKDALFEEAARLIVIQQQGSTSLIQRKFSIGYNRAGRIMDQLEAAGIVGGAQGSKPREVLIMDEYSLEQTLSSL